MQKLKHISQLSSKFLNILYETNIALPPLQTTVCSGGCFSEQIKTCTDSPIKLSDSVTILLHQGFMIFTPDS